MQILPSIKTANSAEKPQVRHSDVIWSYSTLWYTHIGILLHVFKLCVHERIQRGTGVWKPPPPPNTWKIKRLLKVFLEILVQTPQEAIGGPPDGIFVICGIRKQRVDGRPLTR